MSNLKFKEKLVSVWDAYDNKDSAIKWRISGPTLQCTCTMFFLPSFYPYIYCHLSIQTSCFDPLWTVKPLTVHSVSIYYIHRKKRFTSFPSPAGMLLIKLPLGGNNDWIIPAQGEFGSDIPSGDGKLANFFFWRCTVRVYCTCSCRVRSYSRVQAEQVMNVWEMINQDLHGVSWWSPWWWGPLLV